MNIKGTAKWAALTVNGSGDISADKLAATEVIATVSGSGDISCYASKQLDAKVSGSGDIEYKRKSIYLNKQGRKEFYFQKIREILDYN